MKALLSCGTTVDIELNEHNNIVKFVISPAENLKIEDTLYIRDGVLNVFMTVDSVLGFRELLNILVQQPKKKKWWRL